MAKKKSVKKGAVKEIFDLEIDEVSAVDMAAIGESFYITKSINNKKGAKVAKKKKLPLIKAMPKWSEQVAKSDEDKCGEHCHFCGITKEVEAEQMGAGLRNSVCIACALEHFEKGVFDDCLNLTFDIEKFKESYPDIKLHESTVKTDEEGEEDSDDEEEGEDSEDENVDGKKPPKKEGEEDSDEDSDEDVDNTDEEDSEKNKSAAATVGENESDAEGSESDNADLSKRVVKLEKSLEDVSGMLERSLELHDLAAGALNEVVTLTFASLDMLMTMIEERMEDGESEEATQQNSLFTSINESIKSVREEVSKAGKKISGKRMAVLREIATKLSELIESVINVDSKKGVTKSAINEVQKSLESFKEEVKKEISDSSSSLKEDIDEKLKSVNTKLEDIEQSGGASFGLGDEDPDDLDPEPNEDGVEKGESVFSDVVGLSDISKNIKRKQRNSKR